MTVSFRPAGYTTLSPMVVVDDAARALDFYRDAFGAEQTYCLPMGDRIGHAEVRIGDTRLMVMDENPAWGANAPKTLGGATGSFMIYVPDADAAIDRAVKAGAKVVQPAEDQFWGDRTGTVVDPFGHKWMLGTHIEDVSPAEMDKRGKQWAARHMDEGGAAMKPTAKSTAGKATKNATQ
jgi:PhnB protein